MSDKNTALEKTNKALADFKSAVSQLSLIVNEKKMQAGEKDEQYGRQLAAAQKKADKLEQASKNTLNEINTLIEKINKALENNVPSNNNN